MKDKLCKIISKTILLLIFLDTSINKSFFINFIKND